MVFTCMDTRFRSRYSMFRELKLNTLQSLLISIFITLVLALASWNLVRKKGPVIKNQIPMKGDRLKK